MFKNFGTGLITNLATGFLATSNHDNSALYRAAETELLARKSLLLSSQVSQMSRSAYGIKASIMTPKGPKIVIAKQVLITIPPKLPLLTGFDLSTDEKSLFSKFNNSAYYTGLIRNHGLPDNTSFVAALPDSEYFLPRMPSLYALRGTGLPGLVDVKFGSSSILSDAEVKAAVEASIKSLGTSEVVPGAGSQDIEWVAYKSHSPFELTVSVQEIQSGFYKKLYALQGPRATWWTGAAFHTHDSSLLWEFTEGIVQKILTVL